MSGKVDYLRISITDRCNLRCIYCQPLDGLKFIPHEEILSYEEIVEFVQLFNELGIKYVRITGGEPLLRRDVEVLISMLKTNCSLEEISMTTNGVLLAEKLPQLVKAGLDRINISLNTLQKDQYRYLTGEDKFAQVWSSIGEVLETSLPLKINVVILKGINDAEILDFASLTLEKRVNLRFIEYFPTNGRQSGLSSNPNLKDEQFDFVPNILVKEIIERKLGKLISTETPGKGPAVNYKISGAEGAIGFISSRSTNFCNQCNRLRLTALGNLYPCLFSAPQLELKKMLREGTSKEEIKQRIAELMRNKRNYSKAQTKVPSFNMSEIGG